MPISGHPLTAGIRRVTIRGVRGGSEFPAVAQYPTTASSSGTMIGPYHFDATPDARPAPGPWPLCVISHGGGGSHLLYRSIATHLAQRGYVTVSPEHPGDNRNDRSKSNTDDAARDRPRQATQAIDAVLADPVLGPVVDASRIAAIGHSMGGYTALALAGGQPWSAARHPIAVDADPRVRAAVLLAPSTDWYLAPDALATVRAPILALVGDRDPVTPPERIRSALAGLPASTPVTIEIVPGAGHFAFLTPFPAQMRRPDFPPSVDPEGFDRDAFHEELPRRIATFLDDVLALVPAT